ncbi:MAG: DUF748 domain-containing protein [Desulfomonilaceae bacterium]|nr:DUF748 domain-containing protein [Desulfomonilaceae bacterium]
MRHYKKILTVITVLVLTAAIGVIVAVRFLPETDLIRNGLRDKLSALTGHNVRLGALKVSLSFPGLLNLTLEGVSVSSKEGKSLLEAGTVAFSPSLISLFSREVSIESVEVRRLTVVVRRAQDGRVENPFVPAPGSGVTEPAGKEEPKERPVTVPADRDPPGTPIATEDLDPRLKWSVDTIRIVDARVELLDREIVPGEPARTSLDDINCTVYRQKPGNVFTLNLDARLTADNQAKSPISADGTFTVAEDFSRLKSANVTVSLKSLDLKGLHDYVPPWARPVEQFDVASSRAEVTWGSDENARIEFKVDVSGKSKEAPQLKFQGLAVVANDFSALREIRGTGESDRLPLRLLGRYFPEEFPLDPSAGTVKASIEGSWVPDGTWILQGNVGLEEAVPTGRYAKVAAKVRMWSQLKLTPELLHVESLEISGPATLAALTGTISNPLTGDREYDLQGRANVNPSWLEDFGVTLPKDLTIEGAIPVQGLGRGNRQRLWIDLTGDLKASEIRWAPYVEKARGNKGTVSIKGNFLTGHGRGKKGEVPEAEVRVGLSGATVRVNPGGPRLSNCAIDFASKVLFNSGGPDLRKATLALRRGTGARNIMVVRADLLDAGSGSARVNGNASVNLDETTLALVGLEIPPGLRIAGSTQLRAGFKGPLKALDWSVDVPLTHLDVQVNTAFRKPGGVIGNFSASGSWALEELTMTTGKLTLPGVTVTGKGSLRDKNGTFRGLTLAARNAELKQMAKLVPPLTDKGLSGGIDFTVHLRPQDAARPADGTVRLLNVDYRPQNAAWEITNMRGTVETDGIFLESSGLTGEIKGPVHGPLTVKGKLNRIQSAETVNGRLSVDLGKGSIQAGALQRALGTATHVFDALFRPGDSRAAGNRLEFDSAEGTITIGSGIAKTEDLRMKGRDLSLGGMGSYGLKAQNLDMLLGIRTYTIAPSVIGKIPAVRKLVKQHEGLLKALGVDKELKRLGVGEPDKDSEESTRNEIKKTAVTVLLKLTGRASSPQVVPVLESALDGGTANRMKSLLD